MMIDTGPKVYLTILMLMTYAMMIDTGPRSCL